MLNKFKIKLNSQTQKRERTKMYLQTLKIWFQRVMFAMFILSIYRLMFVFFQFNYFKPNDFRELPQVMSTGLLFDVQALVYCLSIFHLLSLFPINPFKNKTWFNYFTKAFYLLGVLFVLIFNLIDFEFFKIKTRRSGIELFQMINDPSNPIGSYLVSYWYLLLVLLASCFVLIKFYPKYESTAPTSNNLKTISKNLFLFLVVCGFLVVGARGGLQIKPLRSFDAARFVKPEWSAAATNSITQLITSYNSKNIKEVQYFELEKARKLSQAQQKADSSFIKTQPNIVLIILESFGRDYCGFLNKKERFTPFLDQLAKESYYFENAYSNGYSSIESIPAIFTSVPSLLDVPYINSNFQGNTLKGIHYYLSKQKYDCSFYYGAQNGSMGFLNFLKTCGPIDYFGLDEYPNKKHHDGHWGIWDSEYLNYFSKELNQKPSPFFSTVFTLSSHDPYKVPSSLSHLFAAGELPIHKAVRYTDYSLKLFFESAKQQKWFDNTIFIITADHTSYSKEEYFYSPTGKYEIPLMFYAPKLIKPGINDSSTVSQCDIFPSIMSLCNVKDSFFSFGRNVFNKQKGYALNYDNGMIQLIQYPYCVRINQNLESQMHLQTKDMKKNNLAVTDFKDAQIIEYQESLSTILKAKHQYYIHALLNNQYFIKK